MDDGKTHSHMTGIFFVTCQIASQLKPPAKVTIPENTQTIPVLDPVLANNKNMSHEKNRPTFHYTDWFIGILI